jgi:cell wall assembly regulator SMI1
MAKKKQLTWEFANEPVPRSAIAELEKELGVTLPEDYVRCALRNHGGSPSRMAYDMPDEKGKVL